MMFFWLITWQKRREPINQSSTEEAQWGIPKSETRRRCMHVEYSQLSLAAELSDKLNEIYYGRLQKHYRRILRWIIQYKAMFLLRFSPVYKMELFTEIVTGGCFIGFRVTIIIRPYLYGLGYPRQPFLPRQFYRAFISEKFVPVGRVKVNPALLPTTLIKYSNARLFVFLFSFFPVIRSLWALLR